MITRRAGVALTAGGWAVCLIAAATEVEVLKDRVNLRARPDLRSEVVLQSSTGERLRALTVGDEWVEIAAPDRTDCWVHREFVENGRVKSGPLNVRSGAGINFNRIATLQGGDSVTVRGEFGEWIKIAPPPGTVLYVSRSLVRTIEPPTPAAPPALPAPPQEPPATPPAPPAPPPAAPASPAPTAPPSAPPAPYVPSDLRLVAGRSHGATVDFEGTVRPVPFLLGKPSRFQLVTDGAFRSETLCYLRGNDAQLAAFEGRRLAIRGREYWAQGLRHPVVVVDRIELRGP